MEPSSKRRPQKSSNENNHYEVKRPHFVRRLIKAITVHAACFTLIYTPSLQAQDMMDALGGAIGIINGGMQQVLQQQQAQVAQAQMQAQMASLQPQAVPSKYHPQCAVAKAVTDFLEGACSNPIGDEAGAAQAAAFRELAISYESFYKNLTAMSQNSPQPTGLQCIQEANKRTDAQLQDKINALQALINQVKKETQAFEQNQQKLKEEMDKNRGMLYGFNQGDSVATQNQNFLKDFTPACQTFFKNSGQRTIIGKGFAGLRDFTEPVKNQAGTFANNRQSYINDINNQLKTIRQQIAKDGLSVADPQRIDRLLSINGRTFKFGSADAIVGATITNFQEDFRVIQRDLSAVGFEVTAEDLNGDFNERMSRFAKGAGRFFKKEAINECVNGKGTTGIGLSTDQILNGLRHRSASGSSTALSSYRTALQNILNSDAFIDDKMAAIKRLDQRYGVGEIFLQVEGADANNRVVTPYGLYKQQIEICEARIQQDDTFSTVDGLRKQGGSRAERIADAERALKKAINLEKSFSEELTNGILNRVVNCEGIQQTEQKCMPGQGGALPALDISDDQFCIGHATTCAAQARSCYIETDTIVKKKQEKMKAMASDYNARVSALIAKQEFFLNQIKAQVVNDAEFIKRFLPGTDYKFPADLFVKMPQEKLDPRYGVAIAGDISNISDLTKDLPKKLGSLKKMLEDQKKKVGDELNGYLAAQSTGMKADVGKWTKLKGECEGAISNYSSAVAAQNAQQAEEFGKSQNFCQRFNALSQNPAAGCGQADQLFEDSMNVTAGLAAPGMVQAAAIEFQNFCNETQNEAERGSEDDGGSSSSRAEERVDMVADACGDSGNDSEEVIKELRELAMDNIPSSYTDEEKEAVEALIEGDKEWSDVSKDLKDIRRDPFIKGLVRPLANLDSNGEIEVEGLGQDVVNALEAFTPSGVEGDLKKVVTFKDTEKYGICTGIEALRVRAGFENAFGAIKPGEEPAPNDLKEAFEKGYEESVGKNDAIRSIASVIEQSDKMVTQSDSGRIGERMRGTPCMAQQGFNGSQGFDINSFDMSILGQDGFDLVNGL